MKYFYTTLFSLFFSLSLIAQNSTLSGKITDLNSGEELISATVRSGSNGTVTDFNGTYILQLPAGEHIIEVSYVGYETMSKTIQITNENAILDFALNDGANILNTATVSSSKFEKSLGETTVSLDVLDASIVENTGATNVNQSLKKVSGVSIIGGQANIRGGSGWSYGAGSRVMLLVDDIPALQADAGFPNWVDLPVENIANIEVVKGAASALYGSSAMNGIINIRTAYATSKPFTRISTFATVYDQPANDSISWWKDKGNFYDYDDDNNRTDTLNFKPSFLGGRPGQNRPGKFGFSVAHRQKFGKTDLVLSAYGLNSQSYRENTYSKYGRFNLGTRHRITDRLSVGFNSSFNRGIGRSYFYWKNAEEGRYRADETAISNSDRFRFTVDPFLTYFDKAGNRHKIMTRYNGINNKNNRGQGNTSGLFYSEYQFQKRWESLNLDITSGVVGIWSKVDAALYNGKYTSSNYAGYLQADKKFFDKLNISAGVRYEQNNLTNGDFIFEDSIKVFDAGTVSDAKPVFRLGANYELTQATFLRASVGQGYRFPVIAEKYILTQAGGIDIIPNPNLEPETGWSAEIAIKQGFKISNFSGFIDVAAFWNEYNDMMEFSVSKEPNPFKRPLAFNSKNIGNTRIKGIEASFGGKGNLFGLPTTFFGGYTFIDPKFKDLGKSFEAFNDSLEISTADFNVLKYRSKHSFKFDIESSYKIFSLAFTGTYNSKIEAIDPILGALAGIGIYRSKNDRGYKTFGLRFAVIPSEHIRVGFIADNIFNEEYMVRPGLLEAPRNYTLKLDYTF